MASLVKRTAKFHKIFSRTISTSKVIFGSNGEPPFPQLDTKPLDKNANADALLRYKNAEKTFLENLFVCHSGGGEKGIKRHVEVNKKVLVRDRICRILDDDTDFFEICPTAGLDMDYGDVPGAGTVTGIGTIRGKLTMIMASDGSLKGGTSYPITVTKSLRAQEIAMENRLPCLYVVDSGGAFLPLQAEIFPDVKHGGRSFRNQAVMSGLGIPQVAIVAGPCTAGGAYTPTMSDEAIMVNRIGHVFLGGPPLVKAATGEVVSHDDLGGARLHTSKSGVADYYAESEEESFAQVRDVISGLNLAPPDFLDPNLNPPACPLDDLDVLGGRELLTRADLMAIIARIADNSRFSEFKAPFGANVVTGFCLLGGQLVAILANCGPLTACDGQKGCHFVQLCDARDIPMVFLQSNTEKVDVSDYAALKETAKLSHACANAGVPKVSVNVGGLNGLEDMVAMCGPSFGARFAFSWPLARMTKTNLARNEFLGHVDNVRLHSAQNAASNCTIDGVILPRETRTVLAKCLQISLLNYEPRHGRRNAQNSVVRM